MTSPKTALVVVDVQNDFCPGGALGVPQGDMVVPVLNGWIERFRSLGNPVAFTLDWHPKDHCSFQGHGGTWPPHCVANTQGAELRKDLVVPSGDTGTRWAEFKKGFDREHEAYSGFDGHKGALPEGETLEEWLRKHDVDSILVGGLATDYCVKATILDGLRLGFRVSVIRDGIRAVEVNPGDGDLAIAEMLRAGALVI